MANRFFQQFFFSLNHMPVFIEGSCAIGATGAVSNIKGSGISTIVRNTTGIYQIKFEDPYMRYLKGNFGFLGGVTGGSVASTALVTGTTYQITAVGSTNWQTAGLPTGVVAAIGQTFTAIATSAGTGTAKAIGSSGIMRVEAAENPQVMVTQNLYPYIIISCYDKTDALADPANGSRLMFDIFLRNSSVKGKGE